MKKLGLIGGMGPESTIPYYHDIVYGVREKLGNDCFPELTIENVNVYKVLGLCENRQYDELTDYLLGAINNLAKSGSDFAALTANTPHIVFDRLESLSPIPLVSIIDSTCNEALRLDQKCLGLMGTIFTMTGDFYKKPFIQNDVTLIVPTDDEMDYINRKIAGELEVGIVKEETLHSFQKIITRMKEKGHIESVILGCTELPLILNDKVSPVPCLDTMKIHVKTLVDMIVQ